LSGRTASATFHSAPGASTSSELIQTNQSPVARARPFRIASTWPRSRSETQPLKRGA
jgi:hypothetical protein